MGIRDPSRQDIDQQPVVIEHSGKYEEEIPYDRVPRCRLYQEIVPDPETRFYPPAAIVILNLLRNELFVDRSVSEEDKKGVLVRKLPELPWRLCHDYRDRNRSRFAFDGIRVDRIAKASLKRKILLDLFIPRGRHLNMSPSSMMSHMTATE